jgi:RNA polymerase sigma-70 factor, ECF subfamily
MMRASGKRQGSTARPDASGASDWSALMARAQSGDQQAYRRLLKGIVPYLRFVAARFRDSPADVEDAVQDILLTLHALRHFYDPARPFRPWLIAVARRRLVDRARRAARRTAREVALQPIHETVAAPATNLHERASEIRRLRLALAALPPAQRRAVELMKLGELSLKKAAAITGLTIGGLKISVHRAMKALRIALASESER